MKKIGVKNWRWLWLYRGIYVLWVIVILIPFTFYAIALSYVKVMDFLAGKMSSLHSRCYNHDLAVIKGKDVK